MLLLTVLLSGTASAQDASVSSITSQIDAIKAQRDIIQKNAIEERQKMLETRASTTENYRERMASTSADLKNKIEEIKSDIEKRIGKKLDEQRTKIAQRFEEAIKNIDGLVSRVESRITKMESAGADVSSLKVSLEAVKANIATAQKNITDLENMLALPIATSSRKTTLANIKVQTEKTKKSVETAHRSLVKVVASLKPGQQKVKATSTREVKGGNEGTTTSR